MKQKKTRLQPRLPAKHSVGIVGLGQIGGSIIRCLAKYRPALTLYGTDNNTSLVRRTHNYCRWRGSVEELVDACDMLILAVPVPAIITLISSVAKRVRVSPYRRRLIVMDVGTVKQEIMKAARRQKQWFDFAGLHPLAGSEGSGWKESIPGLFQDRDVVLCKGDSPRAERAAREVVRLLGARVLEMDAREHDRLAAVAIGLPHILALAAQRLDEASQKPNALAGGSWASLTRVAASDLDMVAGFLGANRTIQLRVLEDFQRHLDMIRDSLRADDLPGILSGGG